MAQCLVYWVTFMLTQYRQLLDFLNYTRKSNLDCQSSENGIYLENTYRTVLRKFQKSYQPIKKRNYLLLIYLILSMKIELYLYIFLSKCIPIEMNTGFQKISIEICSEFFKRMTALY